MKKDLALFDFDGTITTKDSIKEFLKYIEPNLFTFFYKKYVYALPINIAFLLKLTTSDELKKHRISTFFKSKDFEFIKNKGSCFANEILPNIIKKSAMERIELHKFNNDDIYIISASLDIILNDWCLKNNLNLITNVIDADKKIYINPDCNYNVKLELLKSKINLTEYNRIYAYGDSEGDLAMLSIADEKYYNYFN